MSKYLGYMVLCAIALTGCQSISDEELEILTARAHKAQLLQVEKEQLALENKQLREEKSNLEHTLSQLQSIVDEQVYVEHIIPSGEKKADNIQEHNSKNGNIKITLQQGILFPNGSYTLGKEGRAVLKKVADALQGLDDQYQLRIVGHSDNMPVSKKWREQFVDNWGLSSRRAAEIARYMIWGYQFPPERITVVGRSDVEPIAGNDSEEGRAKNRRIELFIEK